MAVFVYRLVDPSSLTMFSNIFTIVFFAKSSSKFLRAEKKIQKVPIYLQFLSLLLIGLQANFPFFRVAQPVVLLGYWVYNSIQSINVQNKTPTFSLDNKTHIRPPPLRSIFLCILNYSCWCHLHLVPRAFCSTFQNYPLPHRNPILYRASPIVVAFPLLKYPLDHPLCFFLNQWLTLVFPNTCLWLVFFLACHLPRLQDSARYSFF